LIGEQAPVPLSVNMALRTPNSVLSDGWMDAKVSYYSTAKDKIFIADD